MSSSVRKTASGSCHTPAFITQRSPSKIALPCIAPNRRPRMASGLPSTLKNPSVVKRFSVPPASSVTNSSQAFAARISAASSMPVL